MNRRPQGPFNRNNVLADFAEFGPVRIGIRDTRLPSPADKSGRVSKRVLAQDGYVLVRYRLNSDEMRNDLERLSPNSLAPLNSPEMFAAFGVIRQSDDTPVVFLEALLHRDTIGICTMTVDRNAAIPSNVIVGFLNHIDVPPTWNGGIAEQTSELLDAWYLPDESKWIVRQPREVVVVTFERICFATAPPMKETTDVFLLPEDGWDLNDPDKDAAYWAKDHYRNAAFDRLFDLPQGTEGTRASFSSWLPKDEPRMAKVVGEDMYTSVQKMYEERETETASPATP